MPPYQESYPKGARVRIAHRSTLVEFRRTWKLHHRLKWWQLWYAGKRTVVQNVLFYHGGDVLYQLVGTPGIWHECCVEAGD